MDDHDGMITASELHSFFAPWMENHHMNLLSVDVDMTQAKYTAIQSAMSLLEEAFATIDDDNSDTLDRGEVGKLLEKMGRPATVRARPGRLSTIGVPHSKSILYGVFVWARRALNSPKRRFSARAEH